jgi:hypothetical protein
MGPHGHHAAKKRISEQVLYTAFIYSKFTGAMTFENAASEAACYSGLVEFVSFISSYGTDF